MANELVITGPYDGLNLYVNIRRVSDSKVWSVADTDWVTWADGDIDDYDVALTDKGGDLQQGTFPSDIAAGTRVIVRYYVRAGATPATSDSLKLTTIETWNGAELVSSSSVALDSRALTTLASAKRALNITTSADDTLITELINQISDRIEREVGRRFAAANYNEWCDDHGLGEWTVRNWPLIRVDRVRHGRRHAVSLVYSGSDVEAAATVYYDEEGQSGKLRLYSVSAAGSETTNDLAFSTYPTLSTLVTAATAISGWTATLLGSDALTLSLEPLSGIDAKNQTAYLNCADRFLTINVVDHRRGIIRAHSRPSSFHAADEWGTDLNAAYNGGGCGASRLVSYRGGYETIPDDVARVANEMVVAGYYSVELNPMIESESIPDYSRTLADRLEITEQQMQVLDLYRTIGVGGAC